MSEEYDKYLKFLKNSKPCYINKEEAPQPKINIIGPNKKYIELKKSIGLDYSSTHEEDIIYVDDISENKQFTHDLKNKNFTIHLAESILYIDFNTDYYYLLLDFETVKQFNYCQTYKKLTIALLKKDKSDSINKWTTDVNLL